MRATRRVHLAAHVHSAWSYDGRYALDEITRMFARLGFDGVLLSEHDRGWDALHYREFRSACEKASTHQITMIPGIEYSDAANDVHVLVWGRDEFLGAALPTDELLARLDEGPGIAVLAHPGRRDVARRLPDHVLERFDGIEVWNRKYDGVQPSVGATRLAEELGAVPFVGLDFHTRRQLFPLSLSAEVDRDLPPREAITRAMVELRFGARAFAAPLGASLSPPGRMFLNGSESLRRAGASAVRSIRWR